MQRDSRNGCRRQIQLVLARRFAAWPKSGGSVFGKGGKETGTSSLLDLSLLDSFKEISHVHGYKPRRKPRVGART